MTSSPDSDIENWKDRTGAEYPFGLVDNITLKTIVRSNPGLVLLEKGKVVNKWSANNLPDEYQLDGRLEDLPIGKMNTSSLTYMIIQVVAWFLIPLLLICIVDVLWERHSRKKITKDKTNNINPLMEIEK